MRIADKNNVHSLLLYIGNFYCEHNIITKESDIENTMAPVEISLLYIGNFYCEHNITTKENDIENTMAPLAISLLFIGNFYCKHNITTKESDIENTHGSRRNITSFHWKLVFHT